MADNRLNRLGTFNWHSNTAETIPNLSTRRIDFGCWDNIGSTRWDIIPNDLYQGSEITGIVEKYNLHSELKDLSTLTDTLFRALLGANIGIMHTDRTSQILEEVKEAFCIYPQIKSVRARRHEGIEIFVLIDSPIYDSSLVIELSKTDQQISRRHPRENIYFEYIFNAGVEFHKAVPQDAFTIK